MRDEQTILLVEDQSDDVVLIRRALEKASVGCPVHVVRDGEEAIRYLAGEGPYGDRSAHPFPTLVLLDLKLPRKSGFDVLDWMRRQSGVRRLPVVVLTSSRVAKDIARAYDHGANSYLVKPVSFDELHRLAGNLGTYWLQLNERPALEAC